MKFQVKENRYTQFAAGILMLLGGSYLLISRVYVVTPFYGGTITIGAVSLRTGIFCIPLAAGLIWLFLSPKKKLPAIASAAGLAILAIAMVFSVSIRVGYVPILLWLAILTLLGGGTLLLLSSVELKKQ